MAHKNSMVKLEQAAGEARKLLKGLTLEGLAQARAEVQWDQDAEEEMLQTLIENPGTPAKVKLDIIRFRDEKLERAARWAGAVQEVVAERKEDGNSVKVSGARLTEFDELEIGEPNDADLLLEAGPRGRRRLESGGGGSDSEGVGASEGAGVLDGVPSGSTMDFGVRDDQPRGCVAEVGEGGGTEIEGSVGEEGGGGGVCAAGSGGECAEGDGGRDGVGAGPRGMGVGGCQRTGEMGGDRDANWRDNKGREGAKQ